MERRKFFRDFAVGGSLLLSAPMIFNSCANDPAEGDQNKDPAGITVDLNDAAFASLKTVGGFAYKGDIIIIRSSDSLYIALSKVCTHERNTVIYNSSTGEIVCPFHGSKFTTSGSLVNGPANANLKRYDVKLSGNILTIS